MSPIRQLAKDYFDGLLDQSEYRRRRNDLLAQQIEQLSTLQDKKSDFAGARASFLSAGKAHTGDKGHSTSVELFATELLEPQPQADDLSAALSNTPERRHEIVAAGDQQAHADEVSGDDRDEDDSDDRDEIDERLRLNRTIEIEPEIVESTKVAAHAALKPRRDRRLFLLVFVLGLVVLVYRFDRDLVWLSTKTDWMIDAVESVADELPSKLTRN
ncbi:MAG: hypothetical protein AAF662_01010 [Pseudomonadota bacterium]